jgi:hypothetical protein
MHQRCYSNMKTEAPNYIETLETLYQATQQTIAEERNLKTSLQRPNSQIVGITSSGSPPPPKKKLNTSC